jgi:hypothetical protein
MNLIVRGDLRSEFGTARHLRDQLNLIVCFFNRIYGVDLHYHPRFDRAVFPYEIISESEAKSMIKKDSTSEWIVLHHVNPDYFIRYPECYNLGYFVWETDRPPENSNWECLFNNLDGLWVSTEFLVTVARSLGWSKDIQVVPWPVKQMDINAKVLKRGELQIHQVGLEGISKISLSEFKDSGVNYFFSVSSDAPRKALPVLLSEWVSYKRKSKKDKSLLLKISTFNFSKTEEVLLKECKKLLDFACGGEMLSNPNFFVITDNLSEAEMAFFYDCSCAFVTTTVGEGFGGPIAEAALMGKVVLSPRHSSIKSIIPENYEFTLAHETVTLGQGPNSFYAPSSRWGLINEGALSEKLIQFDGMSAQELEKSGRCLQSFVSEVCNPEKIKMAIRAFLEDHRHAIKFACNLNE